MYNLCSELSYSPVVSLHGKNICSCSNNYNTQIVDQLLACIYSDSTTYLFSWLYLDQLT